jgi:hypothetical protein
MSFGTPAASWRKTSFTFFATVALLSAMTLSARASTFHMVDSQTASGDMTIALLSHSQTGSQWTITLKATNTGSNTYNNVNLVEQFVWDQVTMPEPALTYASSNSWSGTGSIASDSFTFTGYGLGANPATTPLVPFPWTNANTPLTWGGTPSQGLATVSSTDTLPAIPLGNFGPLATESFNLAYTANNFNADILGFYVAVPEPSTVALLVFSGIGLFGYVRRRRALQRRS